MDIPKNAGALIMIVDDDWTNRDLMETILTAYEYDVILANNGKQALKLAANRPPDLVLLDVRMPDMDGYEVCKQLKAAEITQNTPVVMVSGIESSLEARQKAVDAGAIDLVRRMQSADQFAAQVADWLKSKPQADG